MERKKEIKNERKIQRMKERDREWKKEIKNDRKRLRIKMKERDKE